MHTTKENLNIIMLIVFCLVTVLSISGCDKTNDNSKKTMATIDEEKQSNTTSEKIWLLTNNINTYAAYKSYLINFNNNHFDEAKSQINKIKLNNAKKNTIEINENIRNINKIKIKINDYSLYHAFPIYFIVSDFFNNTGIKIVDKDYEALLTITIKKGDTSNSSYNNYRQGWYCYNVSMQGNIVFEVPGVIKSERNFADTLGSNEAPNFIAQDSTSYSLYDAIFQIFIPDFKQFMQEIFGNSMISFAEANSIFFKPSNKHEKLFEIISNDKQIEVFKYYIMARNFYTAKEAALKLSKINDWHPTNDIEKLFFDILSYNINNFDYVIEKDNIIFSYYIDNDSNNKINRVIECEDNCDEVIDHILSFIKEKYHQSFSELTDHWYNHISDRLIININSAPEEIIYCILNGNSQIFKINKLVKLFNDKSVTKNIIKALIISMDRSRFLPEGELCIKQLMELSPDKGSKVETSFGRDTIWYWHEWAKKYLK